MCFIFAIKGVKTITIFELSKPISGAGFDKIDLLGMWSEQKHLFQFIAKREKTKMLDAKLYVFDDSLKLILISTDPKMAGIVPKKSISKVKVDFDEKMILAFDHQHTMKGKNTKGHMKIEGNKDFFLTEILWDKDFKYQLNLQYGNLGRFVSGEIADGELLKSEIELMMSGRHFSNKFFLSKSNAQMIVKDLMEQNFSENLTPKVILRIIQRFFSSFMMFI